KQRSAAILLVIDPSSNPAERRAKQQRADHAKRATTNLFANQGKRQLANPLGELHQHVSDETVADHHVDQPTRNILAFDVAGEVDSSLAQERVRLLHELAAFGVFLAITQQTDDRTGISQDESRVAVTHYPKLIQMLGTAVGVRPDVENQAL